MMRIDQKQFSTFDGIGESVTLSFLLNNCPDTGSPLLRSEIGKRSAVNAANRHELWVNLDNRLMIGW